MIEIKCNPVDWNEVRKIKKRDLSKDGGTSWLSVKVHLAELLNLIFIGESSNLGTAFKMNVLDMGCGKGESGLMIRKLFPSSEITGIDGFQGGINDVVKQIYKEIFIGDITKCQEMYSKYNIKLLIDVLEHIPQDVALKFLQDVFDNNEDSWFIISTPNWRMPQHGKNNNVLEKHVSWWDMTQLNQLNPNFSLFGERGEALYAFKGKRDLSNWKPEFCTHLQKDVPDFLKKHNITPYVFYSMGKPITG